jgi:hypothetical protein
VASAHTTFRCTTVAAISIERRCQSGFHACEINIGPHPEGNKEKSQALIMVSVFTTFCPKLRY